MAYFVDGARIATIGDISCIIGWGIKMKCPLEVGLPEGIDALHSIEKLHIETEMHHISIGYDVFFSFDT